MLEQQIVDVRGGHRQIIFTKGEGPPVIWLHDMNGVQVGHPLIDELARTNTVIAPQAPGFDDLAELAEIRNIHELAIYYDDVMEALGIERAPVVGHSFGAMIGAELAAHFPGRVSRLVLIAPLGLWNDEYPVPDMFAVPYHELPELLYAEPPARAAASPVADVEALVRLSQGMTTVAKFFWPIPDRGISRRLGRVTAPTLVVFGDRDKLVPVRYADDWVALVPNATKVVISGAGHMVPIERPTEVCEAVRSFLAELVPA